MKGGKKMKLFGKILIVCAMCILIGSAVSASAHYPQCMQCQHYVPVTYPAATYVPHVVSAPPCYGFVTTSVSVVPVTTAITYVPSVLTAYPYVYPAPIVIPRIVTVPTYAGIR